MSLVSHRKGDETRETYEQGRTARVAVQGLAWRSLAAVAVLYQRFLLSARQVAGAVLGRVRLSSTVSSASPVVAAVRLCVAAQHRLVAALSGQVTQPPLRGLNSALSGLTNWPLTQPEANANSNAL